MNPQLNANPSSEFNSSSNCSIKSFVALGALLSINKLIVNEEELLQENMKFPFSEKLSNAEIDSAFERAQLMHNKQKMDIDSIEESNMRLIIYKKKLALNIGDASSFVLDESGDFYKKNVIQSESKPILSEAQNIINHSLSLLSPPVNSVQKRVKILNTITIYEYDTTTNPNELKP